MWRDRARQRDPDDTSPPSAPSAAMAPYGSIQPPSVAGTSSPGGSSTAAPTQRHQAQSSTQDTPGAQNPQHKRVYQACIPCRRRKVRCDLGSVDNPHDPPCVRCRRESKECFFSATRRKRKTDDDGSDADEYIIRNGRKRVHASGSPPPTAFERIAFSEAPLTPGGSTGRSQPLRRPDGSRRPDGEFGGEGDANQTLENFEAQTVMRRGMFGPHDALDLLYKAATDRYVANSPTPVMKSPPRGISLTRRSPVANHERRDSQPSQPAPPPPMIHDGGARHIPRSHALPVKVEQPVDPELVRSDLSGQPGYVEAIRAWQRFRFVRAGWFTALEAIEYID